MKITDENEIDEDGCAEISKAITSLNLTTNIVLNYECETNLHVPLFIIFSDWNGGAVKKWKKLFQRTISQFECLAFTQCATEHDSIFHFLGFSFFQSVFD